MDDAVLCHLCLRKTLHLFHKGLQVLKCGGRTDFFFSPHQCRNCNCAFIKSVDDCQYTMSCFCITCHQNTLPAAACSEIKTIHSNWIQNCKRVPKKVLHCSLLFKRMLLLLLFAILELMEPLLHSFNLLNEQLFMGTRHEVTP